MDVPSYLLGKNASGGGGGTTDYQALSNKPSINGVTLSGNKTTSDLGIEAEPIYLGDITEFISPNYLELNGLKKGFYLISCETYTINPTIRLKVKNGENEFFGTASFSSLTATDRLKENAIYLYVENEIPDSFSESISFGRFSYEVYSDYSNNIIFKKVLLNVGTNSINASSIQNNFNLSLVDKAQTISAKKTFTTLPESSVVPTTDDQLVNKKYVDDNAGGGGSYTAGTNIEITNENVINNTIPYLEGTDQTYIGRIIGNIKSDTTIGTNAVGIGNDVDVTGSNSVAIGWTAAAGGSGVAIGNWANSKGGSIAIGRSSVSTRNYTIALGEDAQAQYNYSIAIGTTATTTKNNQVVFGGTRGPIREIAVYTNNGLKAMATEEFVANYLTTVSDYDNTKTQVLKNVNGTLTWVDE